MKGFSLIEVMMSAALAGLAISGTVTALLSVKGFEAQQVAKTNALTIAEDQIEELLVRFRGDDDINAGNWGPVSYDRAGKPTTSVSDTFYTLTWEVRANEPIENIRRIEVTVRWDSTLGEQELSLQTERS